MSNKKPHFSGAVIKSINKSFKGGENEQSYYQENQYQSFIAGMRQ